jgi:tetratricopeptide (TPR) repeat protein
MIKEESSNPSLQYESGIGLHSLAILWNALGDYGRAQQFARRSVSILDRLADEHPDVVEYRHQQAYAVYALGQVLMPTQPDDAEAAMQRSAALYEELISRYPYNADYFRELPLAYGYLSKLRNSRGATREADQAIQRLAAILEKIPPVAKETAPIYSSVASALKTAGRHDQLEKAQSDLANIAKTANDPTSQNLTAWVLLTDADPAWRNPKLALQLAEGAVAAAPKDGSIWNTLGVARYRSGDWTSAIQALEKSMRLRSGGIAYDWFFMAMAHWQLGQKDEAHKWYRQAVDWMENNAPKHERLVVFRAEAAQLLGIDVPKPEGTASPNPPPTTDEPPTITNDGIKKAGENVPR